MSIKFVKVRTGRMYLYCSKLRKVSSKSCYISKSLGDSHLADKKYWIISRVVEVITSQSNEIYHEWPKATSDKFITLTSDYLNHE